MSFLKDVFSNFFAMVFSVLGVISIFLGFISCGIVGASGGNVHPFIPLIIFVVVGLILIAVSRAFAKRG